MSVELAGYTFVTAGKVRDLYAPDGRSDLLLLVADDRISAFDQVLSRPIPGRAALLTELTRWWFAELPEVPNHLADGEVAVPAEVAERATLVRRLSMHPVECVVRGYVTGSGYKEYRQAGSISGVPLPEGLQDGDRLPEPIFTPAFKADLGSHDENIPFERVVDLVGASTAEALRGTSLEIFHRASAIAEARGVILADTKFEFGDDDHGVLTLGDEVLTPDSSRYWDAAAYADGRRGVSFDKQIVRDWLTARWDGEGTPPELPDEIVQRTADRYRELVDRLTA
jgi:phosphoribosylaminoimidazole-succinocarboxamide synthase